MVNFRRLWRDWLIAFVPIVSVVLIVYIFIMYPNEKIEMISFEVVDTLYRSLNATTFRFGISMSLLVSFSLAFICAVLYNTFKLKFSLPTKVSAKLKSKYIRNQPMLRSSFISIVYELNFELEDKEIKQFNVTPDQFSLVFENNKGILTYKEHSKSLYLDFEVLEING